ncbi:MAG: TetR/AcrR family transcriptional regulator [Parasphingopyxis sp.]|uniref:TetR/AcrR family transcriptional regulator n=1 Tax=Parasphingopyxis sp. TaxID=1920299 RepID=UPI003F9F443F
MKAERRSRTDRSAQIAAVAYTLVAREGPGALTLRAVAERVGIKLASLQYHVATKDALIALVVAEAVERYRQLLEPFERAANRDDPEKALADAVALLCRSSTETDLLARFEVHFWSLAETEPAARKALDDYLSLYREFLAGLISAARPTLSPAELKKRVDLVSALTEGATTIGMALDAKSRRDFESTLAGHILDICRE